MGVPASLPPLLAAVLNDRHPRTKGLAIVDMLGDTLDNVDRGCVYQR